MWAFDALLVDYLNLEVDLVCAEAGMGQGIALMLLAAQRRDARRERDKEWHRQWRARKKTQERAVIWETAARLAA